MRTLEDISELHVYTGAYLACDELEASDNNVYDNSNAYRLAREILSIAFDQSISTVETELKIFQLLNPPKRESKN